MRGATAFHVLVVILLAIIAIAVLSIALTGRPGAVLLNTANNYMDEQQYKQAERARQVAASTDTNNLVQALKLYKLEHKRYPPESEGLDVLTRQPRAYLDKLPLDPWGRPYHYANPGKRAEIEVFSAGADGLADTDDDIGSDR